MNIPYTVEARPDTGLTNGKLGIWLFLASEVMLFGALFSTYVILRTGAETWPQGSLSVPLGAVNTVILISSSVTMVMAWASLKLNDWAKHRLYLIATFVLAGIFLVNKYFEYEEHLALGDVESARLVAGEAVTAFPEQAAAHAVFGRVLLAGRYLDSAEEAFLEALKLQPDFAAARRLLGTTLAAGGRFEEAIANWQRWRQIADRPPEELALQESVDRLQAAARLLADAVRGWYD